MFKKICLRKMFKTLEFDVLICAQANLRINFLYPMINAKRKIGFDSVRGRDAHNLFVKETIPFKKEHSLEAFLGFSDFLGADSKEIRFDLPIGPIRLDVAKNVGETFATDDDYTLHFALGFSF